MFHPFSRLAPAALYLSLSLIAADPELRPPTGSVPRETPSKAAEDSLPKFGESSSAEEAPEVITRVAPKFPEAARIHGVDGTVIVEALIDRNGHVRDTKVRKSIPMLDAAAMEAVRQWVFKPAKNEGKPIAVWASVPIKFTIDRTKSTDPRRAAFDSALVGLRESLRLSLREPALPPTDRDALARERVIRMYLGLNLQPEIPQTARELHAQGRARLDTTTAAASKLAVDYLAEALYYAPYWADPYYDVATALERAGRPADAAVALDLYLVADPQSTRWEQVRRKLVELRGKTPAR